MNTTPGKVNCVLYIASVIVTVRCTYTDTTDAAFCAGFLDDAVKGICKLCDIRLYVVVGVRTYNGLGKDGTTGVNNAAFGGLSADIDT